MRDFGPLLRLVHSLGYTCPGSGLADVMQEIGRTRTSQALRRGQAQWYRLNSELGRADLSPTALAKEEACEGGSLRRGRLSSYVQTYGEGVPKCNDGSRSHGEGIGESRVSGFEYFG